MKKKGIVLLVALGLCSARIISYFITAYQSKRIQARIKTKSIELVCDSSFSKTFCDRLALFAKEQEKIATPPAQFVQLLQETFSVIDSVTIRSNQAGFIVEAFSHTPTARINEDTVLLQSGMLARSSDLQEEVLKDLPSLAVAKKGKPTDHLSKECRKFIRNCTPALHNQYTISWYDDSYILLEGKDDKKFSLIGASDTLFDTTLLAQCEKVKKKIMEKNVSKGCGWHIDVRFKSQIIAFRQKGGKV